jgi:hypothetical protein
LSAKTSKPVHSLRRRNKWPTLRQRCFANPLSLIYFINYLSDHIIFNLFFMVIQTMEKLKMVLIVEMACWMIVVKIISQSEIIIRWIFLTDTIGKKIINWILKVFYVELL